MVPVFQKCYAEGRTNRIDRSQCLNGLLKSLYMHVQIGSTEIRGYSCNLFMQVYIVFEGTCTPGSVVILVVKCEIHVYIHVCVHTHTVSRQYL